MAGASQRRRYECGRADKVGVRGRAWAIVTRAFVITPDTLVNNADVVKLAKTSPMLFRSDQRKNT